MSILNAAVTLETVRALPSNRLEALKGDRAYSIRINAQWRICDPDGGDVVGTLRAGASLAFARFRLPLPIRA